MTLFEVSLLGALLSLASFPASEPLELKARCTDAMSLYADGVLKGDHNGVSTTKTYSIPDDTQVVGIKCKVDETASTVSPVGGLMVQFKREYDGDYQTDSTWRCSGTYSQDWEKTDFDDSIWPYATVTGDNSATANSLPRISSLRSYLKWIWTANKNTAYGDTTIFCRGYPKVKDTYDSYGRRFVIGFMDNYRWSPRKNIILLITTLVPTDVSVWINTPKITSGTLHVDNWLSVKAGEVQSYTLPMDLRHYDSNVKGYSVLVTATQPVKIIGINQELYSTDMCLMIPITSLGTSSTENTYYTVGWDLDNAARVLFVSDYDNTVIKIKSPISFTLKSATKSANTEHSITLNKYETVQLMASTGFSGTKVVSSKPLVLYSGNKKSAVKGTDTGGSLDHLVEQLTPTRNWGQKFYLTPMYYSSDRSLSRTGKDLERYKYIGGESGTTVTVTNYYKTGGQQNREVFTLTAGQVKDLTYERGTHAIVTSTKGIQVVQFSTTSTSGDCMGDPWMQLIPPTRVFSRDYGLLTPALEEEAGCPPAHFVTILVKNSEKNGITVNGNALNWNNGVTIHDTGYVYITERLTYSATQGQRIQHSDTSVNFGVYFFGYGRADSYGSMGGSRMAPINEACVKSKTEYGDGIDNDCDDLIDEDVCTDSDLSNPNKDCASPTPIDGEWTSWQNIDSCSDCSATSGGYGKQLQTRTCTDPVPQYNGLPCSGDGSQILQCDCVKVDGGWTTWGAYGQCSTSCGAGSKTRSRSCTNPFPSTYPKGDDCPGSKTSTASCQLKICAVWTTWGSWNTCSCSSGTYSGSQSKTRTCQHETVDDQCSGSNTASQSCNCPKDGVWNSWGSYGTCSENCGTGSQSRTRTCNGPLYGGANCNPTNTETVSRTCNTGACPYYESWSNYGSCVCSQGTYDGLKTRSRTCTDPSPSQNQGVVSCSGANKSTAVCNCPKAGVWNTWSSWGTCSKTCATGSQTATRTCEPPMYGGADCSGSYSKTQNCNTLACPSWGTWGSYATCVCQTGVYDGIATRSRSCVDPAPAQNQGAPCPGSSSSTQACNCPKDGVLSQWTSWDTCTELCETGTQDRTRTCTPPMYGGQPCGTPLTERQNCNTHGCPQWNAWGSYGTCVCPSNVWDGVKTRHRTCDHVSPYNNHTCSGPLSSTAFCNCPRDGQWAAFTAWSTCTKTCENGTTHRNRTCTDPTPLHGGANCSGAASEVKLCNTHMCPIHGGWSNYTVQNNDECFCPNAEIHGAKIYLRTCTNPEPQYGGDQCAGNDTRIDYCQCQQVSDNQAQEAAEAADAAAAQEQQGSQSQVAALAGGAAAAVAAIAAAIFLAARRKQKKKEEEKKKPNVGKEVNDTTLDDLE